MPKKNFARPPEGKKCPKMRFFQLFSETALTIFLKTRQNVVLINIEQLAKTACKKINWFSRYGLKRVFRACPGHALVKFWRQNFSKFFFAELRELKHGESKNAKKNFENFFFHSGPSRSPRSDT